jgi:hypothetical protein
LTVRPNLTTTCCRRSATLPRTWAGFWNPKLDWTTSSLSKTYR